MRHVCDGCSRDAKDCGRLFRTPIDPFTKSMAMWLCKECKFESFSKGFIKRRGWMNYVREKIKVYNGKNTLQ